MASPLSPSIHRSLYDGPLVEVNAAKIPGQWDLLAAMELLIYLAGFYGGA